MRRQLRPIILLVLVAALLTLAAAPASAAPPYVLEVPVTTATSTQYGAVLAQEAGVVYADDRNGDWDIFFFRLIGEETEVQLTESTADQRQPAASTRWAVWVDDRNGNLDIYQCDLFTLIERQLTTDSADQTNPAVDGNRVVYEDLRNGNSDIYAYDMQAGTERRLTSNTAAQVDPAISGNRVAWADKRSGGWDIYVTNLAKGTLTRLAAPGPQTAPAIHGTTVVYQDRRNGNWDVYAYDLSTKRERRLTSDPQDQTSPHIYRDQVVYQDDRNGNWDIYDYWLVPGKEVRITDDAADQTSPSIQLYYDPSVLWTDMRDGDPNPYRGLLLGTTSHEYEMPSPDEVRYGKSTSLFCDLGAPIGAKLWLYAHTRAGDKRTSYWRTVTSATGQDFTVANIQHNLSFRVVFRGDASTLPAYTEVFDVGCYASLTTPKIKRPGGGKVTIFGVLKPRHKAGSFPVKIRVYGGDRVVKTLSAKASDFSGYTKYSVTTTLRTPGLYRFQAVHSDGDHLKTVTALTAMYIF